jgi:hypothetical protein
MAYKQHANKCVCCDEELFKIGQSMTLNLQSGPVQSKVIEITEDFIKVEVTDQDSPLLGQTYNMVPQLPESMNTVQ